MRTRSVAGLKQSTASSQDVRVLEGEKPRDNDQSQGGGAYVAKLCWATAERTTDTGDRPALARRPCADGPGLCFGTKAISLLHMATVFATTVVALITDPHGTFRVRGSRVTLDAIVTALRLPRKSRRSFRVSRLRIFTRSSRIT